MEKLTKHEKIHEFHLLKQNRLLYIFSVQTLGCLNDNLFKTAFIILVTYKTLYLDHFKPASIIFMGATAFILPMLFFSPYCGQLIEKYAKHKLIQYCKIFEIATALFAILALALHHPILMILVIFMLGLQSTLFVATKLSMVPEIGDTKEYLAINGIFDMGLFVSSIIGTLLGGLIVLMPYGPIIVTTAMLLISITSYLLATNIPPLAATQPKLLLNWNLKNRLKAYLSDLKGNRTCHAAILGIAWFWSFATIFLTQTSHYVKYDLKLDGDLATFYITLFSIGIAIGAVLCEKVRTQTIEFRTPVIGAIGISIFVYLFISVPTISPLKNHNLSFFTHFNNWINILNALLIGIASAFYMVPLYALIHHTTNKVTCPSAICLNNIIYSIFVILSASISITLIQFGLSIKHLFLLVALLNIIFNLLLFIYEPKFIKNLALYTQNG